MKSNELIKRSTMDKIAALAGAGGGVAAASALGTTVGSAGLLGTIGSAFGLTIAAATPVGWLVGGAALGAAALYGGSKLVGVKGVSDGDAKAHRQFNSDIEKSLYMQLTAKLSQKDIAIAKKLLTEIPSEYDEWRKDALDGLDKGTMAATDVVNMCCKILNRDVSTYLKENDFSINDIERTIKIAILMALADGNMTDNELYLIKNHVNDFFDLSSLLDETEIELIFSQALGTDEQQKQLKTMSFAEIQTLLVVFFLVIENDRLKEMLLDFLADIAQADDEIDENEDILYMVYMGLLSAEMQLEYYLPHLEALMKTKSDILYSPNTSDDKTYQKKLKNALNSYAKGIPADSTILLYDATIFGKADNGFILTPLAIITDQSDELRVIPLGLIHGVDIGKDDQILFYTDGEDNSLVLMATLDCVSEDMADFLSFLEAISTINNSSTSLDSNQEWHLAQNGNQLGVHSLQDIDNKIASSELTDENLLVWKDGMPEWLPATEIEEINSIIEKYKVATPPPLPSTPPPLPS